MQAQLTAAEGVIDLYIKFNGVTGSEDFPVVKIEIVGAPEEILGV